MFLKNKFIYLFLLSGLILLNGCVAIQSFPTVARSGDTITLVVGSPDGMTKTNTTATFVSDVDSSVVDLPIRTIIRLRPDQTSYLALYDGLVDAQDYYTGHSQWLSVIVIDLPDTMTVGSGHIDVDSSASYGGLPVGINDIPISLEILEGTGVRNDFTYNNNFGGIQTGALGKLQALPQVVFKSLAAQNEEDFAAAEIKVDVPMESVPTRVIRVVADDFYTRNAQDQVQMSWSRSEDEFTVNFISPTGSMNLKQLRFSVVISPGNFFLADPGPNINSIKIYDVDGELMFIEAAFAIGIE